MQIHQQPLDRRQIAMIDYFITEDLAQVISNHREELEDLKTTIAALNLDPLQYLNLALSSIQSFAKGAGRDSLSLLKDLTIAHTAAAIAFAKDPELKGTLHPDLRAAGVQ